MSSWILEPHSVPPHELYSVQPPEPRPGRIPEIQSVPLPLVQPPVPMLVVSQFLNFKLLYNVSQKSLNIYEELRPAGA